MTLFRWLRRMNGPFIAFGILAIAVTHHPVEGQQQNPRDEEIRIDWNAKECSRSSIFALGGRRFSVIQQPLVSYLAQNDLNFWSKPIGSPGFSALHLAHEMDFSLTSLTTTEVLGSTAYTFSIHTTEHSYYRGTLGFETTVRTTFSGEERFSTQKIEYDMPRLRGMRIFDVASATIAGKIHLLFLVASNNTKTDECVAPRGATIIGTIFDPQLGVFGSFFSLGLPPEALGVPQSLDAIAATTRIVENDRSRPILVVFVAVAMNRRNPTDPERYRVDLFHYRPGADGVPVDALDWDSDHTEWTFEGPLQKKPRLLVALVFCPEND